MLITILSSIANNFQIAPPERKFQSKSLFSKAPMTYKMVVRGTRRALNPLEYWTAFLHVI